MPNQSGTLTSSQGSTFIGTTPNDTITFTPTGTYTVEYPLGTVAISASTSTQSLPVSGGQVRVTCASGSVAWAVSDGNDGTPLSQTELLSVRSLVSGARGPTIVLAGDSLSKNAYITTADTFVNRAPEGIFNWFDAYLGAGFNVLGVTAAAGTTAATCLTSQIPQVIALRPRYCWLITGINDINVGLVSGAQAAANVIACVQALIAAGIVPIWTTVFAQTYDSVATRKIIACNDILRRYAYANDCGLFWDGFLSRVDPTSATNNSRGAAYSYDSTPYLHPNNVGAQAAGAYAASVLSASIPRPNAVQAGNETVAYTDGASNLLLNPGFTGTAGTVSANCTGTMPDSWVIDWQTRTGTASAAAAIVSLTDPASGLVIAQGVQVTISGNAASGDIIRITQTDVQNATLKNNISTGNLVQCEGVFKVATGANISTVALRLLTNGVESTAWGQAAQALGTFPATMADAYMRSYPIAALGSGVASAARLDFRVTFNGVGTGSVITFWRPRVRKVS